MKNAWRIPSPWAVELERKMHGEYHLRKELCWNGKCIENTTFGNSWTAMENAWGIQSLGTVELEWKCIENTTSGKSWTGMENAWRIPSPGTVNRNGKCMGNTISWNHWTGIENAWRIPPPRTVVLESKMHGEYHLREPVNCNGKCMGNATSENSCTGMESMENTTSGNSCCTGSVTGTVGLDWVTFGRLWGGSFSVLGVPPDHRLGGPGAGLGRRCMGCRTRRRNQGRRIRPAHCAQKNRANLKEFVQQKTFSPRFELFFNTLVWRGSHTRLWLPYRIRW